MRWFAARLKRSAFEFLSAFIAFAIDERPCSDSRLIGADNDSLFRYFLSVCETARHRKEISKCDMR
jgi:hypothetical protein